LNCRSKSGYSVIIDNFGSTWVGISRALHPLGSKEIETFINIVGETRYNGYVALVRRGNTDSSGDFVAGCGTRGTRYLSVGNNIDLTSATTSSGNPDRVIESAAPCQNLLVGGNVAVELGVGNIIIIEGGKVHRHGIPAFARDTGHLSAVKVGFEVGPVANVKHLVGDIEADLSGKKRCGLNTCAHCAKILYGKCHGYTRRPESIERI